MALLATDRLADTERILRDGQREAEVLGLGWSLPHWHAARACALLEQGALDDAAVEAEASLTVADELEITRPNARAWSVLALVEIRRGDLARARDHLRAAEAGPDPATQRYGRWVTLARACLADAEGGLDAPAAAALTAGFGDPEPTRLLAVRPSHWPAITRIALRGGDPSVARAVSGALRALTARDDSERIIRAVRAHVDGLLHSDPRALESAISAYRSGGRPLALAAACEDLGELLATSADTAPAIPYLEEAGELASASGALRDHERISRRLRRLGVRTGAADGAN